MSAAGLSGGDSSHCWADKNRVKMEQGRDGRNKERGHEMRGAGRGPDKQPNNSPWDFFFTLLLSLSF